MWWIQAGDEPGYFWLGNDVEERSILLDLPSIFEPKMTNKILVANFLTILVGGFNPIEKY